MTAPPKTQKNRDPGQLGASLRFVLRRYFAQLRRMPGMAIASLLLPALGEVLSSYGPPLLIARLLGAFARGQKFTAASLAPYILAFAALWLAGQALWRIAMGILSRVEIRCMEALYVEALDELLARDLTFFQDNYAGSLTKRALGYARRFEDVFDVLCFQVASTLLPLVFVAVVLWSYSPWLIVALVGMLTATLFMVFPLIRHGRQLVDIRESASNVLAGHVADSIANAEAVRAFARESHEARIHAGNVFDFGAKTLTSWDYQIGLVGRSGGGKTTLSRLLLRFSDIESGEILIGRQSIARIPQAVLRKTIAYVPQDPSMFHRSIADNIRVGRPDAADAEVFRAARLAHADEFIEALPGGYETMVGERGVKLSGGQRQRIAIARAILKDAPILILDEATSSLDSESEALIQDALWTLLANRTAIVIAHRLSTVKRMDELIILDGGKIAEKGTHDELLARNGIYALLWAHQSGGFLAGVRTEAPSPSC